MPNVKPRFEVHEIEGGEVDHTIFVATKDDKGKHLTFKKETVKRPAGWMIYFPNGSSIRLDDPERLKQYGFDRSPTNVDMESGDELGDKSDQSLRSHSEQKTKTKKRTTVMNLEA